MNDVENTIREEQITAIFRDILPACAVSPDTDFFTAGGDSLKAAQILTRIVDTCGASVSLVDFFSNPTIRGLTQLVTDTPANDVTNIENQSGDLSDDEILKLLDAID